MLLGGSGGLASAILLASAGLKVKVIERLGVVGGRTSAIEAEGFRFDVGPTFFLFPRVLEEIFATAGADLRTEVELVRLDPQYRIIFGEGGELQATPDVARMEEQIAAVCASDAPGFRRFLEENRVKLRRMEPCSENPFLGWGDMVNPRLLKMLPMLRPHQSVDTYLRRFFQDRRIRLAFSFQSKYLGMSPFRCPSLFPSCRSSSTEYGVFHPLGGCSAVTAAMARLAERLGVEIRLNEPVEEMLFRGRRAVGVRTAHGVEFANALVLNADFARAMSRMVPDRLRRRWTDRKIARKKFSCSTFMMYLGSRGPGRSSASQYPYFGRLRAQSGRDREPARPLRGSLLLCPKRVRYRSGARSAWNSALYVLAPVTHQHPNVDWARERGRFRTLMLRQIAKAGFADV